ncbi:hypothetical protein DWW79_02825, partial [Alistipes sp. AF17-16]
VNSRGEPQLSAQAQLGFPASGKQWKGMLPTVQTQGLKMCNGNGKTQFYPVGLLPTPRTSDHKPPVSPRAMTRKNGCIRNDKLSNIPTILGEHCQLRPGKTSLLNPRFVAEMMGFPTDWTELPSRNGEKNRSKPTAMR